MCQRPGCRQRGEHYAACASYGDSGRCRGCVPRRAAPNSVLCPPCFNRTRALLMAVPDMLAHLRGLTNPLKGTDYAQKASQSGGGGRLHAPPPVPVELLDAVDYLVTVLWSAREVVEGRAPVGAVQVPVGASVEAVHAYAVATVAAIVEGLPGLTRRAEAAQLAAAVIGSPASRDDWTVRTIFERWSLREEPRWAAQPCPVPACGLRTVRVTPARMPGDETTYECSACGWSPPSDEDGFWAECFSRQEGKAA